MSDPLLHRLSLVLSRREVGASALAAALLRFTSQPTSAKKAVHATACIPTGKKCPSKKPRGKKGHRLGCDKCCQKHSEAGKCTCQPDGKPCAFTTECCLGVCDSGTCRSRDVSPPPVPPAPPAPPVVPPVPPVPPPPPVPQCAPIGELEACAEQTSNSITLVTTCPATYGAFSVVTRPGLTFAEISSISTHYDFGLGTCGAGTPRVCVTFTDEASCVCGQFPASLTDCETGGSGDIEFIGNATPGDWFALCAAPLGPVNTYAEALALYGGKHVDIVFAVVDESHGEQAVTFTDFCVKPAS